MSEKEKTEITEDNSEDKFDEVAVRAETVDTLVDDKGGAEILNEDQPIVGEVGDSETGEEESVELIPEEASALETNLTLNDVGVGDTVRVHFEIVEGGKSRLQPYEGLVIAEKGSGVSRTKTVRHIAKGGVGVERIFPVNSPLIKKVDVLHRGKVRRAKLYYLRSRVGKGALKVKEKK